MFSGDRLKLCYLKNARMFWSCIKNAGMFGSCCLNNARMIWRYVLMNTEMFYDKINKVYTCEGWKEMLFNMESINVRKSSMNTCGYLYGNEILYIYHYTTHILVHIWLTPVYSSYVYSEKVKWIKYVHIKVERNVLQYEVYRCMKIFNEYIWISI